METWGLRQNDLWFLADTLLPRRRVNRDTLDAIRSDERFIEAMLDDERLFERLMAEDEALLLVSPWLFFTVLLRKARRDLERETYTMERRHLQKVVIFDTDRVIELLDREAVRDYLAAMLASFTRVESVTVRVRVRPQLWRKYRTNTFDVEGLIAYCQALDEPFRFEYYRRIADVCLFLSGMFPEHIESQYRYPLTRQVRPRARGQVVRSRGDFESHGRAFYRLAAEHERAGVEGLSDVLMDLSENFIVAEKPLVFLANRYLGLARHRLFEV